MSQSPQPAISVVVPAFDRERTLGATLDSLLSQTFGGWEAIVVDDGSRDRTAAIAAEYAERDERVHLLRQPHGGVSAARNAGIAHAKGEWLFFLDADDWITPTALEALLAATDSDPDGVDVVYGGYVRVDREGRATEAPRPQDSVDLFPIFARTCAFSIHSCIARTELIQAADGFDETLVTCEDWDLWQRLARGGARFAAVPEYLAFYEMRTDSVSADGRRMFADGLRVIGRGHGEDVRVVNGVARHQKGLPASGQRLSRLYFACYTAGLAIAAGADPLWMLEELGEPPPDPDGIGVAETLFHSVANGRASAPEGWPEFAPAVLEPCHEFIDALGEWTGNRWLSFQAHRELQRLLRNVDARPLPKTVGDTYFLELDCFGEPPAAVSVDLDTVRARCNVTGDGMEFGCVEFPICDGRVPPRVVADRIAEVLAWDVLKAWFSRAVYPSLADGTESSPGGGRFDKLHEEQGWATFLQQLWDRPDWSDADFYSSRPEPQEGGTRRAQKGEPVAVELTEPLPAIELEGRSAAIGVTLGGVPIAVVEVPATEGRVQPAEIRVAALESLGFELCLATVRELILAPASAREGGLGDGLRAASKQRGTENGEQPRWLAPSESRPLVPGWQHATGELLPEGGGLAIGRRAHGVEESAANRYALLPAAAREELLAGAAIAGDPTLEIGEVDPALPVAYVPGIQWDRRRIAGTEVSAHSAAKFDHTFAADADPWDYETSDYEQRKYAQTLSLVPGGVERALEIGCAEGAFTERLAGKVGSLLACDVSRVALSRAERRCAGIDNVSFRLLDLLEEDIPAGYDLIVCSETLYVAIDDPAVLEWTIDRLIDSLSPGGYLLTANAHTLADDGSAPGFDWDVAFGGRRIAEIVLAKETVELVEEIRTDPYGIQVFLRRARPRRLLRLRGPITRTASVGEMSADADERYRPEGGEVRREDSEMAPPAFPCLPILMYHRIAPTGAETTSRYRTHPDHFGEQLEHLREAGYYSVSLAQWHAASSSGAGLPGKPVVITFDDGYADFPEIAAPLLEGFGFQATVYVVAELIGEDNRWDADLGETLRLMSWEAIEGLAAESFEIGSHSCSHQPLPTLGQTELATDLARSKRLLEERLGSQVDNVSYPYGLHDVTVTKFAGACGYTYGVTTDHRSAVKRDNLLELPRLEIHGGMPIAEFARLLEGE